MSAGKVVQTNLYRVEPVATLSRSEIIIFSLPSGSHQPTSSAASATGVSKNKTAPIKPPSKPQLKLGMHQIQF
jgi:hypothetical protein